MNIAQIKSLRQATDEILNMPEDDLLRGLGEDEPYYFTELEAASKLIYGASDDAEG